MAQHPTDREHRKPDTSGHAFVVLILMIVSLIAAGRDSWGVAIMSYLFFCAFLVDAELEMRRWERLCRARHVAGKE